MVVQMYSEARLLKKIFDEVPKQSINVINESVWIYSKAIPSLLNDNIVLMLYSQNPLSIHTTNHKKRRKKYILRLCSL